MRSVTSAATPSNCLGYLRSASDENGARATGADSTECHAAHVKGFHPGPSFIFNHPHRGAATSDASWSSVSPAQDAGR